MRLTPRSSDKTHLGAMVSISLIGILSVVAAFLIGMRARDALLNQLGQRSQSIASALSASEVTTLSGTENDSATEAYKSLKAKLAAVKIANPDTRSVYIMGRHPDGQLFFYVDSETPDSSQYSPAGTLYLEGTPQDSAIFDNGETFVEGPTKDEYGTFISGLSPIYKPGTRDVVGVVGLDIDAYSFLTEIAFIGAMPLLIGSILSLILVVYERIRRHNAELLALRSELVSVASHELRNPITGIRWAAESMQKITSDEKVLSIASAILRSAQHLQASTDDILELSHATNGRALDLKPTDLNLLIREIIETQALSAEKNNITIAFDEYWPAKLMATVDPDQMRRALHNVISNAIKYTRPNTSITISYQQDQHSHKILVTDQGIGIPAGEQSKVWRGFYRASNAVRSEVPGTGLGLYLVKTVIERHNGSVSFVSQENKGTTFTIILPK